MPYIITIAAIAVILALLAFMKHLKLKASGASPSTISTGKAWPGHEDWHPFTLDTPYVMTFNHK